MAYTETNFKSKKAFKEAVAQGDIHVFQPGPFGPTIRDGIAYFEGPHYPEPHKWYAKAMVKDGKVLKGTKVS